jgi:hypothetical protein
LKFQSKKQVLEGFNETKQQQVVPIVTRLDLEEQLSVTVTIISSVWVRDRSVVPTSILEAFFQKVD